MTLMTRKGGFNVLATDFNDNPSPIQFLDALVRVQGACGSAVNSRGQLSGFTLHTPALKQIEILEGVFGDPYAMPTTSIGNVAKFDPDRIAGRRIKISGMITLFLPGQGFFVQNGADALHIYTPETSQVEVGKSVDVLGFPDIQDGSPILKEAIFRVTGTGSPPQPQKTTAEQILRQGTHHAAVVQLEGVLLQSVPGSARNRGGENFRHAIGKPAPRHGRLCAPNRTKQRPGIVSFAGLPTEGCGRASDALLVDDAPHLRARRGIGRVCGLRRWLGGHSSPSGAAAHAQVA
jgi:hypothetical protein